MSFSGTKGYITKPKPGVMLNPLHPLSRGLVGHWLFNEGAGSRAYDISGYSNHGTLKNMSPNIQGSGWGGSQFGGGLEFDGASDYISMSDISSLAPQEITVSTWIKPDSFSDWNYVIANTKNSYNFGYRLELNVAGDAYFAVGNGVTPKYVQASAALSTGSWQHLTATFDGQTVRLYIDGIEKEISASSSFTINYTGTNFKIGYSDITTNRQYYDGSINDVQIYNRALSAAEVKQLYNDPFCNLLQVPIRRYSVAAAPPVGAIMNQFQRANLGADLYNGVFA